MAVMVKSRKGSGDVVIENQKTDEFGAMVSEGDYVTFAGDDTVYRINDQGEFVDTGEKRKHRSKKSLPSALQKLWLKSMIALGKA